MNDFLLRSYLFLPANNEKYIKNAINCSSDGIILDMEESVLPKNRKIARANIKKYFENDKINKKVFVRINEIDSNDFIEDIEELSALLGIDGFMPSKIRDEQDVYFIDRLLSIYEKKYGIKNGYFKLTPLIETTRAVERVSLIAGSSNRLMALCLGGEDYLSDLGCVYTYQHSALEYARASLVNAARSHGLLPIDTPYLDINNMDDYEKCCTDSFKNGFAGDLLINPRQIEIANQAYIPDINTIEYSERVLSAIKKGEQDECSGVAMLDGEMVGIPMQKKAERAIRLAKLAEKD